MANITLHSGLEEHALATQITNWFTSKKSGKQEWENRVKENIEFVYATSTRETSDHGEWSNSTHIPKITQIHDNLSANYTDALFGGRDWFEFSAGDEKENTVEKAKAVKAYLETKHDWNDFVSVMGKLLQDWVQTGNCFARVEYVRIVETNEDDEEAVVYEGPRVVRISPYDVVMDYRAESFDESPVCIRSIKSRSELIRDAEEQPNLGYDPEALESILEIRRVLGEHKAADINKLSQQQFDGFTSAADYFQSGDVEILEFIGDIYDEQSGELLKNHIITVADRRFVLRKRPLNSIDGRRQIYHCGWRDRPDNLWAMGPLDNLAGMQYRINHLENARADAFDQMLSPDRVHIGNVQIEQDGPVTNYFIDDGQGNVFNLAPDSTVLNADFQIERLEAQMEAYAGAPREAMGIRTPGEKTKFEVAQLQNAAGRMFQHKLGYFERNFVEPVLNGELEISQRSLNTVDVVKTIDDDLGVTEFLQITKDDLTSKGKLKARGASHFAKKAQAIQELQAFAQALQQDPEMKVHFPPKARAKIWATALDFGDNFYAEFGGLAEAMELQEMQMAAEAEVDRTAASVDDLVD